MQVQDKRHKVVIETLEPGTKVLLKNEGIIGKLETRYKGPYYIKRVTKNNNYLLIDATETEVDVSFPLHKLKVVNSNEKETEIDFEVEKILDDKVENKTNFYLVKWKNLNNNAGWLKEILIILSL